MTPQRIIDGAATDFLLVCDHASNAVPDGIDLGISHDLLTKHIAVDIGAGTLTESLAAALGAPAILATASRLVIDLNRTLDHVGLISTASDGYAIPGNLQADRAARIAEMYLPYHAAIEARIAADPPLLIAAIHSFTPILEASKATPRPWQIGILSNQDRRAADLALEWLGARGLSPGDNEPYSGQLLNATLDRHGEACGIASLSIEIRNDLIGDAEGIARWTEILAPMLVHIRNRLAPNRRFTT